MCGICGVVYNESGAAPRQDALLAMREAMHHRGPDEAGLYVGPGIGLGHRRLRIIDLSNGRQPIANEDGQIQVVFNGEIYNFRELRARLEARGHRFTTRSDTEVIVHLYEEVGGDFASHLEGMFAIALWDARKRSLWLARDHLGKKPLFYYEDPEKLVFASELKAVLAYAAVPVHVSLDAVLDYLHFGYVPAPRTILREVHKLPPGHVACWKNGLQEPQSYWEVPLPREEPWGFEDACDAFREAFEHAVRRRLISDVPLGAFLSGGLDSAAVVAMMSRVSSEPVRTFTIGFGETSHDESADARRVAGHLGTQHTELRAEAPTIDLLPEIVHYMDEPMADSSALPTFLVSRLARTHVTVALSGDGGDELLGGYRRYFADRRDQRFLRIPRPVRAGMGAVAGYCPDWMPAKRYFQYVGKDSMSRYLSRISLASTDLLRKLVAPGLVERLAAHPAFEPLRAMDHALGRGEPAHRFTYIDYQSYLPNDILVKVDRMSMASALEVRSPFVDHRLLELVSTFPASFRATQRERKRVLRAVAGPWLPPETLAKPKHGFSVPIDVWFRRQAVSYVESVLLDRQARSRGLFRERAVGSLLRRHQAGRADHSPLLWALLCLELWLSRVVPACSV
jgi:asparagine synthase (glutamine-hydrolysing)